MGVQPLEGQYDPPHPWDQADPGLYPAELLVYMSYLDLPDRQSARYMADQEMEPEAVEEGMDGMTEVAEEGPHPRNSRLSGSRGPSRLVSIF
jgi:hypothetical protein